MRDGNWPIELTNEERARGFQIVRSKIGLHGEELFVAVLPLDPSTRLSKFLTRYHLQVYATDTHPLMRGNGTPQWHSVGIGPSNTIEDGLRRYKQEPIDPHWKKATGPEEPPVSEIEAA